MTIFLHYLLNGRLSCLIQCHVHSGWTVKIRRASQFKRVMRFIKRPYRLDLRAGVLLSVAEKAISQRDYSYMHAIVTLQYQSLQRKVEYEISDIRRT